MMRVSGAMLKAGTDDACVRLEVSNKLGYAAIGGVPKRVALETGVCHREGVTSSTVQATRLEQHHALRLQVYPAERTTELRVRHLLGGVNRGAPCIVRVPCQGARRVVEAVLQQYRVG